MEETTEIQEQRRLLDAKYRREIPKAGELWHHFKNNEYKIIACPVMHTESREIYCVYQALYGAGQIWVRPQDIFFSKVALPDGTEVERFKEISI